MSEEKNRKKLTKSADLRKALIAYMGKTGESSNYMCEKIRQNTSSRIAPQTVNGFIKGDKRITSETQDYLIDYLQK